MGEAAKRPDQRAAVRDEVTALTIELIRQCAALAAGLAQASGLAATDVTGLRALDVLGRGRVRVGVLRRELSLSPAATSGLVDRLERAGLVSRHADPDDRRAVLVELSPLAREFGARHLRPIARRLQHIVASTDTAELLAVQRFMSALLRQDDSAPPDTAPVRSGADAASRPA